MERCSLKVETEAYSKWATEHSMGKGVQKELGVWLRGRALA
jgi:hypothetical protein